MTQQQKRESVLRQMESGITIIENKLEQTSNEDNLSGDSFTEKLPTTDRLKQTPRLPSLISEIPTNPSRMIRTGTMPLTPHTNTHRRKSNLWLVGINPMERFHNQDQELRKSFQAIDSKYNIGELFKEPSVGPDMLERRTNRRKKLIRQQKEVVRTKKKNLVRSEKFSQMLNRERRIPFHQFTSRPRYVVVDKHYPFSNPNPINPIKRKHSPIHRPNRSSIRPHLSLIRKIFIILVILHRKIDRYFKFDKIRKSWILPLIPGSP